LNTLGKIRSSKKAKTAISMVLVVALVLGVFFSLPLALGTSTPIRVVKSGSMCIPYDAGCEGWLSITHEFNGTLHKGDLIIIQHVDPKDLKTDYPNSDIIVYHDPTADMSETPIVHRIVSSYTENGIIYFQTKGDGNPSEVWPNPVSSSDYDSNLGGIWNVPTGKGVPGDLVEGKVILRIPYFGWITLLLQPNPWVVPLIVGVILFLLALEFLVGGRKAKSNNSKEFTV
jgi:signal peptidase I